MSRFHCRNWNKASWDAKPQDFSTVQAICSEQSNHTSQKKRDGPGNLIGKKRKKLELVGNCGSIIKIAISMKLKLAKTESFHSSLNARGAWMQEQLHLRCHWQ